MLIFCMYWRYFHHFASDFSPEPSENHYHIKFTFKASLSSEFDGRVKGTFGSSFDGDLLSVSTSAKKASEKKVCLQFVR